MENMNNVTSIMTIKVNLDNPEGMMEFKRYAKSLDMAMALFDISHNIAKQLKYKLTEDGFSEDDSHEAVETFMSKINDILEERSIIIDDIID